ncbi:MAG: translation initiation factor IF-2 [Rhodovibrionaceae bacterium]
MTTTKDKDDAGKKPLKLNRPGKLELNKTVKKGPVQQSFSHGRSKTVEVEVKRKRVYKAGDGGRMSEVVGKAAPEAEAANEENERALRASLKGLTPAEREARLRALDQAKDDKERREQEAEDRAAREAREAEERKAREAERAKQEAETDAARSEREQRETGESAPQETATPSPEEAAAAVPVEPTPEEEAHARKKEKEKELERGAKPGKLAPPRSRGEPRRRQGKLTISQALEDDEQGRERVRSMAALKRQREREKERAREALQEHKKVIREVTIPEAITVQELANRMAERGGEVVKTLMKLGVMATITQSIDADTAELVVEEFGHRSKRVSDEDVEIGIKGESDDPTKQVARAPIVTVMGHVDHGKTSLLDALRKTDVAAHEAGGITQHIGAYQIEVSSGAKITFIDTPGHAAFTEMRSRGADVTDIVVLVVAADDGVMEQTKEAISHAKAAGVPIIVAINKIDKPDADPNKVKTELLQYELVPEDMGGEIQCIPVSAISGEGLDNLEEAILLQAELLELKADPARRAQGVIVEAKLEQGRGSVATVLIKSGTLNVGDAFVAGSESGRVRALLDYRGEKVTSAGPSVPVEVLGLTGTPLAGEEFAVVDDETQAREIADFRSEKKRTAEMASQGRGTLEQMLTKIKEGEAVGVPVVIKSDVHGSLEAIQGALDKLGTEEVEARVLHAGVGGINESDVTLARASNAVIIAFNVRANAQAREMAKRDNVDIRYYSIIYNVIDDIRDAMSGHLSPEQNEKFLGYAEIRDVFNITKAGKVAGCYITEGTVKRGAKVRLLRDNVVIHDGALKTLKRFKDEVKEVQSGYECGMAFENYQDIQVGDQIECYELVETARTL